MALRVTRQTVEALHEVDSELRVTRQVVEVLHEYAVASELCVTRQAVEVLHPVSSTLRVTRQAVEILCPLYPVVEESVESTFTLFQSSTASIQENYAELIISELGLNADSQGDAGIVYLILRLVSTIDPILSGFNRYRDVLTYLERVYPSTANQLVRRVFGLRVN